MARYWGLRGTSLSVAIGLASGLAFLYGSQRCEMSDKTDIRLRSLYGYDQGDIAGLLTVPSFLNQFPQLDTISNPGNAHVATIQGLSPR